MKLYTILLTKVVFILGNIIGYLQKSAGRCHSANFSVFICCRHYEPVDNRCIACEVGYYTIKAGKDKCEPCPSNMFGDKCAFDCQCKRDERCDNKNGACIPWTSTIETYSEHWTDMQYPNQTTRENQRRFDASQTETIECEVGYHRIPTARKCEPCPSNLYGKKCASLCNCKENERCDSINGTCISWTSTIGKFSDYSTIMHTTNNEPTEASSIKEFTGVHWQTIIYIMIGVLLIFGNIICLYAAYMKSKSNTMSVIGGSVTLTDQPPSSSQVPTVPNDTEIGINVLDHDYEEIDEIHIVNASFHSDTDRHESETDSNSASTISPTEDDEGYLHPYHSLVHLKTMENFVLDEHDRESYLRANVLLQNPYDQLQIPIKISTTSGSESMEMKERSPTSSNKSCQEHVQNLVENTVDPSCTLEETNMQIYAEVERKNLPAQQDQIDIFP